MAVRKITRGIILAIFLAAVQYPSNAFAYTAAELYADFGIEFVDPHSQEDIDTVTAYRCAKRYVRIFGHLSTMSFEDVDLHDIKAEYIQQLTAVTEQLNNGYYLSIDEIYALESQYRETQELLERVSKISEAVEVELRKLDISAIPLYEEYAMANARNTLINTRMELGGNVPVLTTNAYVISDYTDSLITIGTSDLAVIQALFNGEVIDVGDDIVTLYHYNDIYTSYRGVIPAVDVGDTVYQGRCIGYSTGNVSARMRIGNTFVDVYSYLKGEE